ncbi:MAG: hypothetical protein ACI4OP_03810 [Candidatus Coprovivens sp.]
MESRVLDNSSFVAKVTLSELYVSESTLPARLSVILTISSGLFKILSHSTESAVPPPVVDSVPVSELIESPAPTLTPPNTVLLAIGNSILPSPNILYS